VRSQPTDSRIRAILGPTNTGKTHLAIERMCGHSSGAIGFPLRLLAREVFDKVRAIKGDAQVALITGEERIEPPNARYLLCTVEAMPRSLSSEGGDRAFVALDEAQLCADRERGHIFTDRLLNARGREETMILGSATLEPMVRALIPGVSIEQRPRFSTLSHAGTAKLSRLPPRSAIVAFSIEEVYRVAELLKRFRGGAAVVMGALSPETRNRQVELFQSGEVDYIVATDAIGMGLNLDVTHVAFASLSKFDGVRQRRLIPAEMAQIAGRAGRHQRDGTFGTLAGGPKSSNGGKDNSFTDEEIYAIEQHRFAPLTQLYWREAKPRFGSIDQLIADLERRPDKPQLAPAPEAIDLAVLKRLAEDAAIARDVTTAAQVRRLWDVCQLPDFRQQGAEMHARFVARLWSDLRAKNGGGHLGSDFVSARIADLGEVRGDIDTLQGRLAAIRSWAYICQRPDWVLARDEMAARARAVEARLSDALHQRLTERFVNRRTSILMKSMGKDAGLLRVTLEDNGQVVVEGQVIGHLDGFRFVVDSGADAADRKLLLAAAEKYLPQLLAQKAQALVTSELGELVLGRDGDGAAILRDGRRVARLEPTRNATRWRLVLDKELAPLDQAQRTALEQALDHWLELQLAPLAPLRALEEASQDPAAGTELRAVLLTLIANHGAVPREQSGLAAVEKDKRPMVRQFGVTIGAIDLFVPGLLKPAARKLLHDLGLDTGPLNERMEAVFTPERQVPTGYRRAGSQAVRVDMAEKLFRAAHDSRSNAGGRTFRIGETLPTSMGLAPENLYQLLREAGFRMMDYQPLPEGAFGPPAPRLWSWRPARPDQAPRGSAPGNTANRAPKKKGRGKPAADRPAPPARDNRKPDGPPPRGGAFAGLADLLR
jgi:ATP-dependent RNA helicase SUPV3L1/SUV3